MKKELIRYLKSAWKRLLLIVILGMPFGYSISDSEAAQRNWKNSTGGNLSLYIDEVTSCHYLGTIDGGLTPRMNTKGFHICGGWEVEAALKRAMDAKNANIKENK